MRHFAGARYPWTPMQIIIIHHNQYYIYKEYSKPKAHYYGNDKCTKIFFFNLRVHWIKVGNYEAGCIQNASTTTVVVVIEWEFWLYCSTQGGEPTTGQLIIKKEKP